MTVVGRDVLRQLSTTDRHGVVDINGWDVCSHIPHAATDPQYGLFNPLLLIPQLVAACKQLDTAVLALTKHVETLAKDVAALTKGKK